MKNDRDIVKTDAIESLIFLIRNQRVMLDRDLANLYGVETKYLNRQVKRNKERFPEEFMFQLTTLEKNEVVTNCHHLKSLKYSHVLPNAFNEHGVAMLSSILNSKAAIKISIHIIKVFVKLRTLIFSYKELNSKLNLIENKVEKHDSEIHAIFESIRRLMILKESPKRRIGFTKEEE